MLSSKINEGQAGDIMSAETVARHFQKSMSWVYKNWRLLGGEKLGGSLFFSKKVIHQRLFGDKA